MFRVNIFLLFNWEIADFPARTDPATVSEKHKKADHMWEAEDGIPNLIPTHMGSHILGIIILAGILIAANHDNLGDVHQTGRARANE